MINIINIVLLIIVLLVIVSKINKLEKEIEFHGEDIKYQSDVLVDHMDNIRLLMNHFKLERKKEEIKGVVGLKTILVKKKK